MLQASPKETIAFCVAFAMFALLLSLSQGNADMTDTLLENRDFTPTGLKEEGAYENDRNAQSRELFKAIIREVYNVTDVIIAHHLTYVAVDKHPDGFEYQQVQEVPSADALIFDHDVAKKLWGKQWQAVLTKLALCPVPERDALLAQFYAARTPSEYPVPQALLKV